MLSPDAFQRREWRARLCGRCAEKYVMILRSIYLFIYTHSYSLQWREHIPEVEVSCSYLIAYSLITITGNCPRAHPLFAYLLPYSKQGEFARGTQESVCQWTSNEGKVRQSAQQRKTWANIVRHRGDGGCIADGKRSERERQRGRGEM